MLTYIAIGIFLLSFAFIVFELYDKSLVALSGALLMIIFGVLSPEEALAAIEKTQQDFDFRIPLTGEYKIGKTWADTH